MKKTFKFDSDDSPERVRSEVVAYYQVELLNELAKSGRVAAKLTAPAELYCVSRSGRRNPTPTLLSGDNFFRLAGASMPEGSDEIEISLKPVMLEEFSYAVVRDRRAKSLLVFTMDAGPPMGFDALLGAVLDQRDVATGRTNRELIEAVAAAEVKKVIKNSTASHADFGSW